MKNFIRVMCLLLVICMPISASAIASSPDQMQLDGQLTKEEIERIVVRAFPEYAEKVEKTPVDTMYHALNNRSADYVVVNATRQVSDSRSVTYTEFASGVMIYIVLDAEYSIDSTETNGYLTRTRYDFAISANVGTGVAYWEDIDCVFALTDYDNITSWGYNPYPNAASWFLLRTGSKLAENASGPAYINYSGAMDIYNNNQLLAQVTFTARVEVGANKFTVTVTA